jgi:hypothetical protein
MAHNNPDRKRSFGFNSSGFPKQNPAPDESCRGFNSGLLPFRDMGYLSVRDSNNTAGNTKLTANFSYKFTVPPAFRGSPYSMLNMKAAQRKKQLCAHSAQSCEHGSRIGASGNSGKADHPFRAIRQY